MDQRSKLHDPAARADELRRGPLRQGAVVASKYELQELIAKGGMGTIWRARDQLLERPVAVKFMDRAIASDETLRERFVREAKAAARLRTMHVVQIYDFGIESEIPFIVMELLEGEDLHATLKRQAPMALEEVAWLVGEISKGLQIAHDAAVVHRDLKPQNVFLASHANETVVKILDFGVAKLRGADFSGFQTAIGTVLGSPNYMSPEQARGKPDIDHRADLWSLAVIAFRAVTGKLAFPGDMAAMVILKICAEALPVPSQVLPGLPKEMDAFFERALQREPEHRFQTALELANAFTAAVRFAGAGPPRPIRYAAQPRAVSAAKPITSSGVVPSPLRASGPTPPPQSATPASSGSPSPAPWAVPVGTPLPTPGSAAQGTLGTPAPTPHSPVPGFGYTPGPTPGGHRHPSYAALPAQQPTSPGPYYPAEQPVPPYGAAQYPPTQGYQQPQAYPQPQAYSQPQAYPQPQAYQPPAPSHEQAPPPAYSPAQAYERAPAQGYGQPPAPAYEHPSAPAYEPAPAYAPAAPYQPAPAYAEAPAPAPEPESPSQQVQATPTDQASAAPVDAAAQIPVEAQAPEQAEAPADALPSGEEASAASPALASHVAAAPPPAPSAPEAAGPPAAPGPAAEMPKRRVLPVARPRKPSSPLGLSALAAGPSLRPPPPEELAADEAEAGEADSALAELPLPAASDEAAAPAPRDDQTAQTRVSDLAADVKKRLADHDAAASAARAQAAGSGTDRASAQVGVAPGGDAPAGLEPEDTADLGGARDGAAAPSAPSEPGEPDAPLFDFGALGEPGSDAADPFEPIRSESTVDPDAGTLERRFPVADVAAAEAARSAEAALTDDGAFADVDQKATQVAPKKPTADAAPPAASLFDAGAAPRRRVPLAAIGGVIAGLAVLGIGAAVVMSGGQPGPGVGAIPSTPPESFLTEAEPSSTAPAADGDTTTETPPESPPTAPTETSSDSAAPSATATAKASDTPDAGKPKRPKGKPKGPDWGY